MSLPSRLLLILLAAGSLIGLAVPSAVAPAWQPRLVAKITRPLQPILIRNQHGPVRHVTIEVTRGIAVPWESSKFSLEETTDRNDIADIQRRIA